MGLRVGGFGFTGFRVWDSGFRVWGFEVQGLGLRFRVQGLGFESRVQV